MSCGRVISINSRHPVHKVDGGVRLKGSTCVQAAASHF